jgi:hypothetical protein
MDKDITTVLCDIINKLSKKVKYVDLLKVLNYNDKITSLVVKSPVLKSNLGSRSKLGDPDKYIEFFNAREGTTTKKS